jgi:integrase
MSVLGECPICHKKQSVRNKLCKCGEDLTKAKRSNSVNFWISYRLPGGKQKRESIGTSIEEARDADGKRRGQKRENRIFDILPQANMRFKKLSDWYLNLENVKGKKYYWNLELCLMKFNRVFGAQVVEDIKTSELENYQTKRVKEGRAASTIDQEIGAAKAVVAKAFQDDLVGGHVLKRFKNVKKLLKRNSNQRKRVLTPTEFNRLVESATPYLKPILWAGYDTGMREGEILSLTWDKVSLKDRIIKLVAEDTKDHEARAIPICDELYEVLIRLPRGIQRDYPVFTYKGKAIKDTRGGMKNACRKAGIVYGRFDGGFVYHDLRRTFVTHMRRAGVQESLIMEITGHSRGEVFDRYNQVSVDDMRQAITRLTEYRKAQNASVDQNVDQRAILSGL